MHVGKYRFQPERVDKADLCAHCFRYRRVAFLECDLGQSEFTPPGMVALNIIEQPIFGRSPPNFVFRGVIDTKTGPPFTHPTIPNFAHFVGATSPRSSPSHYIAAIEALLQSYRLDVQSPAINHGADDQEDDREADVIPLVVNTMGWTKGLGADLALKIENMIQPTAIFEIKIPTSKTSWQADVLPPCAADSYFGHQPKIHLLEPVVAPILSMNYTPADHRTISILSYFHCVFPTKNPRELQQVSATSWDTDLPLCARPPYEVDWSTAIDKFVLAGAGMEDVVAAEVKRVLNGAIIGLVSCSPDTIDLGDGATSTSDHPVPYFQGSPPPSPLTSNCFGLALIRAVSPSSTHMHVLTPLSPRFLSKSRVAVKGELELPVWGMLDTFQADGVAGVAKGKVPYLQWGKGKGLGAERRRVRRNLMRKGQM